MAEIRTTGMHGGDIVTTHKQTGESEASFHARHADDFTAHMVDNPPDPE